MKAIAFVTLLFTFFSCQTEKLDNGKITINSIDSNCKICKIAKDWQFEDDPDRHKYKVMFTVGANRFIIGNDSVGKTHSIRFNNDSLIEGSNNFQHEMTDFNKGLYFYSSKVDKEIRYSTYKGLGFSINYDPIKDSIKKISIRGTSIILDELKNNTIKVVTQNEKTYKLDTIIYAPLAKQLK